jgi:hypothetical protein
MQSNNPPMFAAGMCQISNLLVQADVEDQRAVNPANPDEFYFRPFPKEAILQ